MNFIYFLNIFAKEGVEAAEELPQFKRQYFHLYDISTGKYFGYDFKLSNFKKVFTQTLYFNGNNYSLRLENNKGTELCTNLTEPCTIDKGLVVDKALNSSWMIIHISENEAYIVDRSNKCLHNTLAKDINNNEKNPESFWGVCDNTTNPAISPEYKIGIRFLDEVEVKQAFEEMRVDDSKQQRGTEHKKSEDDVQSEPIKEEHTKSPVHQEPVVEENIEPVKKAPRHSETPHTLHPEPKENIEHKKPDVEHTDPRKINPYMEQKPRNSGMGNVREKVEIYEKKNEEMKNQRELEKHLEEAQRHLREANKNYKRKRNNEESNDHRYKRRIKEDRIELDDLTKPLSKEEKKVLEQRKLGIQSPKDSIDSGGGYDTPQNIKGGFADLGSQNPSQSSTQPTPFKNTYTDLPSSDMSISQQKEKKQKSRTDFELRDLREKVDELTDILRGKAELTEHHRDRRQN